MTKVVKVQDGDYKLVVGSAPSAGGTILFDTNQGEVVIKGDLTVYGKQTSIDSTSLEISDNVIQINKGETGNGVTGLPGSEGLAGIQIERGTKPSVSLLWNEAATTKIGNSTTQGAFTLTDANGTLVPIKTNSIGAPSGNLTVNLSGASTLVVASPSADFKYHENILDYTHLSTVYSIKTVSRTNNVVTLTLREPHDIVKDALIDVVCRDVSGVSGNLIKVTSTPTDTTVTYSLSGPNVALTNTTGFVSINPIKDTNVIPNFKAIADYMTARDGAVQVDRIIKDNTVVKVEDSALGDQSSRVVFEVNGSLRAAVSTDGLYVDNVKIYNNSIANFSSNSLLLDSTVGIVNTEDTPAPSTGYTSLYSRATVGDGGTSLYFVTTTGFRDELLGTNAFENKIDSIVPVPPMFPGNQQLSIPAVTERRIAGNFTQPDNTGNSAAVQPGTTALVTFSTSYQTNTITDVGPGTHGEVFAIKNKAVSGSRIMTPFQDATTRIGTDNGTYGDLIISNDRDYFLTGTFPFRSIRQIFDLTLAGTVSRGWNEIRAYSTADGASTTNTVRWYTDTSAIGNPVITNLSFTENTPGIVYSSTVPHYSNSTVLNVNFNVSKLSGDTYPTTNTFITGTAGGAFNAPANVTYQQANISTPLAKNLYVSSGSASITTPVTIKSGVGSSSTGFSVTAINGYGTATSTISLSGPVLYKTGTQNQLDETAIPVNSVGNGSSLGLRIVNPGITNTPLVSSTTPFNSQTSVLTDTDATVVASVLRHDTTDYRTYYPTGPNLNTANRTNAQYFTFKFTRTAVSKFDIKYSGTVAGLWIALPGSDIDTTSTLNGWLDASIPYAGLGIPGANTANTVIIKIEETQTETVYNRAINFFNSKGNAVAKTDSSHYFFNTDSISPISKTTTTTVITKPVEVPAGAVGNGSNGCAIDETAQLNVLQTNSRVTVTFGSVSSSSTATNEILVRIKLSAGQSLTSLTIEAASN